MDIVGSLQQGQPLEVVYLFLLKEPRAFRKRFLWRRESVETASRLWKGADWFERGLTYVLNSF